MRIKFWSKPIVVMLVVAFVLVQVLFPAGKALAANSDRVQSPAEAQAGGRTIVTVSGSEADNNLRVSLVDTPDDSFNTGMRVQMFFAGKWIDNIYDPEALPDLPVSKGTSLCIDGREYSMGGGDTFTNEDDNPLGPPIPATMVSFIKQDDRTLVGKWLIKGKIEVEQTITYNDGDKFYTMKWNIKANSGSFSNLSLIHGEDTFLYGSDEGGGWWRPTLGKGSVGVTHPTNGMQMWLQAVSAPPSHYSSQDYWDNTTAKALCALDNFVDPAPDADNGYALQWDRASLSAGQSWSVSAEEHLKAPAHPAITDVNPGSGILAGGNSVLITGENFSKDTEFYFGGVKAACTFISATSVRCTVPAGKVLGPIKIELREYLPGLDINYAQVYSGLYSYKTAEPDLPDTGFAPSVVTRLPAQPAEKTYSALDGLWLEIPSQKVMAKVVGVPEVNGSWDVSWLGADAGWLAGTAYPTWIGNSVITAHVTDTLGHPGPFAKLGSLKYGDRVTVHLSGSKYVFEVRDSWLSTPKTSWSALAHLADHSFLTLVTCSEYDAASNKYLQRRVVRLVMVGMQ